jgi:hypothetical protein
LSCAGDPQWKLKIGKSKKRGLKQFDRGKEKTVQVNSPERLSKGLNDHQTRHDLAELAQVTEHKIRGADAVGRRRVPKRGW